MQNFEEIGGHGSRGGDLTIASSSNFKNLRCSHSCHEEPSFRRRVTWSIHFYQDLSIPTRRSRNMSSTSVTTISARNLALGIGINASSFAPVAVMPLQFYRNVNTLWNRVMTNAKISGASLRKSDELSSVSLPISSYSPHCPLCSSSFG